MATRGRGGNFFAIFRMVPSSFSTTYIVGLFSASFCRFELEPSCETASAQEREAIIQLATTKEPSGAATPEPSQGFPKVKFPSVQHFSSVICVHMNARKEP